MSASLLFMLVTALGATVIVLQGVARTKDEAERMLDKYAEMLQEARKKRGKPGEKAAGDTPPAP